MPEEPQWQEIAELFDRALERPQEERGAWLAATCPDERLRREVERMLAAHARRSGILERPIRKPPTLPHVPEEPLRGQEVGPYRLLEEVGRGGMGVVFKAHDPRLGRHLALKFLPQHLRARGSSFGRNRGKPSQLEARFLAEARAASALDHRNICTIYDLGETDGGQLYIAMAYYPGETLAEKIARGPLPFTEAIDFAAQAARGLARAHEAGIIHRDVKPSNLMVTERGEVKILDFGIAKLAGSTLTRTGAVTGTLAYMSPEQVRGEPVDHRGDVWALGAVLYEMLAGSPPFHGETPPAVIHAILDREPPPLASLRPDLPRALERVVEKALAKLPAERHASAEELAAELAAAGSQEPPEATAREPVEPARGRRPVGREAELDRLRSYLAKARAGQRQVVFVTGGAGLGKTTLVETFLREAAAADVWITSGQCLESSGAGEAYMPVLEAVGRLCQQPGSREPTELLVRRAPIWMGQMPWLLGDEELEAVQRRTAGASTPRMLREMGEALETLTARRPLVMVLEDLHWSDPSTVDLIAWIAGRGERCRLMLIATYRPQEVRATGHPLEAVHQRLRLRAQCADLALPLLTEDEIREYLTRRLSETLAAELGSLLHRRTNGNPLFLVNLVDNWIAEGHLGEDGGRWVLHATPEELADRVPETLRQLIERELAELAPELRATLASASVAGMDFSSALVAAGLDEPEEKVESRCALLAKQGRFLQTRDAVQWPDGTFASGFGFIHGLYEEVIYDQIMAGHRARLHRRIGARLEQALGDQAHEHAAELAVHFVFGKDDRRAVRYLQAAAEQALERSAHREAVTHLRRALELLAGLPDDDERARLELALRATLAPALSATDGWASPELEHTLRRAQELCEALGDDSRLFPVLYGLASMYEIRGEFEQCQLEVDRGRRQPGWPRLEYHELLACSVFHQGEFGRALEHSEQALEGYDPAPLEESAAAYGESPVVRCHLWAALALWFHGFPDRALARLRLGLALAEGPGLLFSLSNARAQLACLHQLRRERQLTGRWARDTMAVATEHGFPYRVAMGRIFEGWALATGGEADQGIARIREGLDLSRRIGVELDRPYFLALLAEACAAAGRFEDGSAVLAEALELVGATRGYFYEAELHRLRGELLLGSGSARDEKGAEASFQQSLEVARHQRARSLELRSAVSLGRLWRRHGRRQEARALLSEVYGWFEEGSSTRDLQEAKALLQELDDPLR